MSTSPAARRRTDSSSRREICFCASFRATASGSLEAGFELVAGGQQLAALLVEGRIDRPRQLAELLALRVLGKDGQPRLRRAQRQLLTVEREPRREHGVLELVLAAGQLRVDDSALARPAQPVQPLALVRVRRPVLGRTEDVELLTGEEVGVPRDDRRLFGHLLLADPNGAQLLHRLGEVRLVGVFVLLRAADRGRAHRCAGTPARVRTAARSASSSNGFGRIASASLRPPSEMSAEPVTRTTGTGGRRA